MPEPKPKVLVVEDEPEIRRFLRVSLTSNGYEALEATKGEEAIKLAADARPQVIILDLGLPDIDGSEVAKKLREWSDAPIIVLSARDGENDKVNLLSIGADDYLTKPFGVQELIARIKVALRHASRANMPDEPIFTAGDITINMANRTVHVAGEEVHLTPIEYNLLRILVRNAGKLVPQQQLLRDVWGPGYAKEGHYLRVYMGQLRKKLESDPANPKYVITEPGLGYRFKME
jgi:two-component system KDP operon response regulator KdpE